MALKSPLVPLLHLQRPDWCSICSVSVHQPASERKRFFPQVVLLLRAFWVNSASTSSSSLNEFLPYRSLHQAWYWTQHRDRGSASHWTLFTRPVQNWRDEIRTVLRPVAQTQAAKEKELVKSDVHKSPFRQRAEGKMGAVRKRSRRKGGGGEGGRKEQRKQKKRGRGRQEEEEAERKKSS